MKTNKSLLGKMVWTITFFLLASKLVVNGKITTTQSGQRNYDEALEAIFAVTYRLQTLLGDSDNENLLISPLSAAILLSELLLGSKGEFHEHLHDFLSLSPKMSDNENLHDQLRDMLKVLKADSKTNSTFLLEEASSLFLDEREVLNENFEKQLHNFYNAEIQKVDFVEDALAAQEIINSWSSNHTNGMIPVIFPQPPEPSTTAVLANAVYLNGKWQYPFHKLFNMDMSFKLNEDKSVVATFMFNTIEDIFFANTNNYKMICLPYKNNSLGMYILLPHENNPHVYNLKEFVKSVDIEEVFDVIANGGKKKNVVVAIPKMSLSSRINFIDVLENFKIEEGREDAAINEIVLEGVTLNKPLKVGSIEQMMKLIVNEKGTEVAALTFSDIDRIYNSKRFLANRPFVFFIRHEETSAILFWGEINDPTLQAGF